MIIKINTKSETPIYLQLRNEVVKGIGKVSLRLVNHCQRCARWLWNLE